MHPYGSDRTYREERGRGGKGIKTRTRSAGKAALDARTHRSC